MTTVHTVTVYSTPMCPYCHMAKAYLSGKHVAFDDVDVSRDRERAMEMISKSGQMGVPVVEIDGEIVVGFRPDVFDRLLS
ncbi:MAG TPA: glutaredoxin domain-containing protein [Candidatus Paceibacterota bacterium]|nr:glutaredoxin domain-containing protein [Candidatus Paceibacterota bacterium]